MRMHWVAVAFVVLGCQEKITTSDRTDTPLVAAPAPPPDPPVTYASFVQDTMSKARSYPEGVGLVRAVMSDETNADSDGAVLLAIWSNARATWKDLVPPSDETSYAKVMKDPESERAKRLCVPGTLVEIHVDRSMGFPLAEGLTTSEAGNLFRFLGYGSTGDLVQGSAARFCGTVIGRYDYPNSGGGVGHAVAIVGMFDLPENRTRKGSATPLTGLNVPLAAKR